MAIAQAIERVKTGEKPETDITENVDNPKEVAIQEIVVGRMTDDDLMQMSRDALSMKSRAGFRLCLIMFVQACNQAGYGVDWAVISGVNAYDSWHDYFGFGTSGTTYGTLNALMTIGNICGAPFLTLGDVIGRRGINFVGNFIVLIAAVLQAFATNLSMFMAGRFLLGFGSAMMSSSQYMAEISPVHLRGRLVGIFGACYQVGSLALNCALIGFNSMSGNWQWRTPFILEIIFPLLVCIFIYIFNPESPRYLLLRGQREKAKQVIAKYHTTSGDTNEPIVGAVISQMEESLETSKAGVRAAWDFRVFFTKAVRYRLFILILYSIFQQWNGGSIVSYYLVPALETVGINDSLDQLGVNLGLTATYFVFTGVGAYLVDKFRRRTLIFSGLITIILMQVLSTITSWQYNVTGSKAASSLTILWIFMYQFFSSLLIATMHNLYPVEILSLPLRAKGMGLYGLIQGAAGVVQSYGISIGINKVGYKIWCVYIVYNTIQLVLSYFVFPETANLSLEEIDNVFETPGVHPVRMSLSIQRAKKEKARLDREAKEQEGGDVMRAA